MSIVIPDIVQERGKKDARRHREKQRQVIKEKLPEIIGNEDIITGKKGKIVRVPIRVLDIPHFRPAQDEEGGGSGIGQGGGKPGDTIGRRGLPKQGQGPGGAGQEPGVDYIESEIALEELIEMMLEDLGLPRLDEKKINQMLVELGWRVAGRTKFGPPPLRDPKTTAKQGYKRFWSFLSYLQQETGKDELTCYAALKQAKGLLNDALELLKDPNFKSEETKIEPFSVIWTDDQRYKKVEHDFQPQSQAVVIAIMDVSGSMDDTKKYLARSALFWLVSVLRCRYQKVMIRFIIHHANARLVDEHNFFHTMESGGTIAASGYRLAGELINTEYPASSWNIYLFHFSDGEDFSPPSAVDELRKLFDRRINMFGYGQINPEDEITISNLTISNKEDLYRHFNEAFGCRKSAGPKGLSMSVGNDDTPYVGVKISKKEDLYPALKEFLMKDRWKDGKEAAR